MQRLLLVGVVLALIFGFSDSSVLYTSNIVTQDWQWSKDHNKIELITGLDQQQWLEEIESLPPSILESLPEIDFQREIPLLVTLGKQPTGGYSINIDQVVKDSSGLVITISRRSPGADDFVSMALTYPYDFVTIARKGIKETVTVIDREGNILP